MCGCPQKPLCVEYEASNHHITNVMPPTLKASVSPHLLFRYYITNLRPPQSSSSGFFTQVARKTLHYVCPAVNGK